MGCHYTEGKLPIELIIKSGKQLKGSFIVDAITSRTSNGRQVNDCQTSSKTIRKRRL